MADWKRALLAYAPVTPTWQKWLPHKPWPKQIQFMGLDCKEAFYGGAAGGGKSDALLMDALQYVHVPGYSAMLFRKTFTDLALPDAIMSRAHEWLATSGAHWDDRDKTYTFPIAYGKKPTLTFGYMDSPKDRFRYQGAACQFFGFDELTQFERIVYLYIFSRLRRTKDIPVPLKMRGAGNPGGVGHEWVGERFGIPEDYDPNSVIVGPSGRVFLPARLEDNPALGDDYEASLRELDEVTYQQLRHGRWILDASELVYSGFSEKRNVVDALPELPAGEKWTRVLSVDFGVTDALAFCVWAFTQHDPSAYLERSDEWTGLAPSDSAETAQQWEAEYEDGFDRIVGDIGGLGKGFAQEWTTRFYIPIEAAKKENKLGYIKLFNGDAQKRRLLVVRGGNEKFIDCIKALRWKDETHRAEHPALPNHLTDAGLYGWRECRAFDWGERPKPQQLNTAAFYEQRERDRRARQQAQYETENDPENSDWILGPS